MPPGVHPFLGTDVSLPPGDLAPLFSLLAGASYVGIGESIHTSGGYYAVKRRLIQELVQQGVRVLAMETPRTPATRVERYLATTCEGSAKDALRETIFGVFADDNTAALFEWLCRFNQQHPSDPVHFYGFDAQQPQDDLGQLTSFLRSGSAAVADSLLAGLASCRHDLYGDFDPLTGRAKPYPAEEYDRCLAGLDALDRHIADHHRELVAATSAEAVALAEIASVSFRSWQPGLRFFDSDPPLSYEARDIAMHRIFARLRDLYFPGQRVAIWAHNYHLLANHQEVIGDDMAGVATFGGELRKEVGDDYQAIGLIGYRVEINWPGVGEGPIDLPSPLSVEAKLDQLDRPFLIVDPQSPWLGADRVYPLGGPGAGKMVPAQQFRALVFLAHSPAMHALYW
jgi:erythromycin esterase